MWPGPFCGAGEGARPETMQHAQGPPTPDWSPDSGKGSSQQDYSGALLCASCGAVCFYQTCFSKESGN